MTLTVLETQPRAANKQLNRASHVSSVVTGITSRTEPAEELLMTSFLLLPVHSKNKYGG